MSLDEIVEARRARWLIAAGGVFHVSFAHGHWSESGRAYEDIRRALHDGPVYVPSQPPSP